MWHEAVSESNRERGFIGFQREGSQGGVPEGQFPGRVSRERISRESSNHIISKDSFQIRGLLAEQPSSADFREQRAVTVCTGVRERATLPETNGCHQTLSIYRVSGHGCHQILIITWFEAMYVTNPYKFTRFGAMDFTKPC